MSAGTISLLLGVTTYGKRPSDKTLAGQLFSPPVPKQVRLLAPASLSKKPSARVLRCTSPEAGSSA